MRETAEEITETDLSRRLPLSGHDDITDPIDNIIAGVRYSIERYGSTSQVPGVESVAQGLGYRPY